jgi:hypothetical protein
MTFCSAAWLQLPGCFTSICSRSITIPVKHAGSNSHTAQQNVIMHKVYSISPIVGAGGSWNSVASGLTSDKALPCTCVFLMVYIDVLTWWKNGDCKRVNKVFTRGLVLINQFFQWIKFFLWWLRWKKRVWQTIFLNEHSNNMKPRQNKALIFVIFWLNSIPKRMTKTK